MFPVVLPVAGYGTRSLPASKSIPKEMLPVFDRPAVQWIVEEAVASQAGPVIFVTSRGKSAIEDHFDYAPDLEAQLEKGRKESLLQETRRTSQMISVHSVRQKEMRGLGHAVLMAKELVSASHFAVMLGDDLVDAETPGLKQLLDARSKIPANAGVVMVMKVGDDETRKYGICDSVSDKAGFPFAITQCREKPAPTETNSRWAIVGRYLLPRDIFDLLESQPTGALGEIQLTDALNALAKQGRLYAQPLEGERFDVGDRVGYLEAQVHYGLKSADREKIKATLKSRMEK
jgi:UTP--glucose-1-phosphate uridylyltransferase